MNDSQPKILVATDGSKASFHAAERAVYLAGHMGAKLYVLYAIDKDRAFHAGIHYGEDLRELQKDGKEATETVAALAAKHGVECEKLVVEGGRPARTIVWAAEEVESNYIVMGTEGMSRLETIVDRKRSPGGAKERGVHRAVGRRETVARRSDALRTGTPGPRGRRPVELETRGTLLARVRILVAAIHRAAERGYSLVQCPQEPSGFLVPNVRISLWSQP